MFDREERRNLERLLRLPPQGPGITLVFGPRDFGKTAVLQQLFEPSDGWEALPATGYERAPDSATWLECYLDGRGALSKAQQLWPG